MDPTGHGIAPLPPPPPPPPPPQSLSLQTDVAAIATPNLDPLRKPVKKRIRKPRGRGLRTKTGCLTCRKRHKKCDERLPICSHCATSNRECLWPDPSLVIDTSGSASHSYSPPSGSLDGYSQSDRPPTSHSTIIPTTSSSRGSYSALLTSDKANSFSLSQDDDRRYSYASTSNSPQHSSPVAPRCTSPEIISATRPPRPPSGPVAPTLDYNYRNGPISDSHNIVDPALAALYPDTKPKPILPEQFPNPPPKPPNSVSTASPRIAHILNDPSQSSHHVTPRSPETVGSGEMLSAGLASTRWLDLLAGDAAEEDSKFTLGTRRVKPPSLTSADGPALHRQDSRGLEGPGLSRGGMRISNSHTGVMGKLDWDIPERYPWQEATDIELRPHEAALFRGFAEKSSLWLDLFDPYQHFSTYAIRLAMRNIGLMKAILALQARHASMMVASGGILQPHPPPTSMVAAAADPHVAVEYYHEALHYVSTALQYQSYAHSEELLGTALVISTYEMLDAHHSAAPQERSSIVSNWQRHLKGVFWVQRSQDVNGASGGLRQAVWWAWLRQDLWAAFRERRRCLSFWRPVVDYPELTQCELANRAVYLLSQAVNYCAESGPENDPEQPELMRRRAERGVELMDMLERWRSFLGDGFRPLPVASSAPALTPVSQDETRPSWQPIWIHPPQFAAAMQVYSFAKILVTLHRPEVVDGFDEQVKAQTLSEAVKTICGVAMELTDPGCQIVSAQCLFGAGLCVRETAQQETIVRLMEACEQRTSWPMTTMRSDLRAKWRRMGDLEMRDV